MTEGAEESLNERAQLLLKALIENYIRDGQPVGSRTLSRDSGLSLSSATIRNVMADLEESGVRRLAAHLGGPHSHRQGLPLLRRYAAQAQAPASRGDRGDRTPLGERCVERPLPGANRLADALERHAHGGSRDAAESELHRPLANRIRRPIGESRARHHGHEQPRGAEPGGAARPRIIRRRSCGARRII